MSVIPAQQCKPLQAANRRQMLSILVCAVTAALLLIGGCAADTDAKRQIVYQSVATAEVSLQQSFTVERSFTGVIQPAQTADIAFEFAGTIHAVQVNEGDAVQTGDVLASLDTALLDIERRQLAAQLQEAQANLRLTVANLGRHASLESDGYASRQRRDELVAGRDALAANINALEAALDGNQVRHDKAHLYAPFAGVVGERFLEQGSTAAPGIPVIRLLETDRLEAHIGVPAAIAGNLRKGQEVKLQVAGQVIPGRILAVGAELKARSHAVTIRLAIDNNLATLAGSVVEMMLDDTIFVAGFLVPEAALTASLRGLWRVYVLEPVAEGRFQVEARDLQLRYSGETQAYVIGGLRDGESIVADGVHKVVPGQLVQVVEAG